jgi:hypothetical protein
VARASKTASRSKSKPDDPKGEAAVAKAAERATADQIADEPIDAGGAEPLIIEDIADEAVDLIAPEASEPEAPDRETALPSGKDDTDTLLSEPRAVEKPVTKHSVWPMFIGGVVAAALGFVAAKSEVIDPLLPRGWKTASASDLAALTGQVDSQAQEITALTDQVAKLGAPDLSEVTAGISGNTAALTQLNTSLDTLSTNATAFDTRLTALEKQPMSEGVSQSAIDAYERELNAMRDSVAAQRSEIESLLSDAKSIEKSTELTAQDALARAALTRVLSALDSGGSFEAALGDLSSITGTQAPAELANVAVSGVTSLVELQDKFPDAARAALSAARLADPDAKNGIVAFLQRQLSARSVAPRDGTDADAVLSRAQAALREGRLNDTLAEIETLPPEALSAMSDWVSLAQERRAAQNAAETLAQSLNSN